MKSPLDLGENATITWTGIYEYDGSEFNGKVTLNNTDTIYDTSGTRKYIVNSIDDPLYNLNSFKSNIVSCNWGFDFSIMPILMPSLVGFKVGIEGKLAKIDAITIE